MNVLIQATRGPALPRAQVSVARPLDNTAVRLLASGRLGQWQELNAQATIPHCIEQLDTSGVLDNFRRLSGELDPAAVPFRGEVFADSDLHKVIEAVAWEIARSGTDAYDSWLDQVIALLQRTQEADGYLMTAIQGGLYGRWESLESAHEMYVLGHLVQAAVALARTAGRQDLLHIARRFVDLVDETFGADGGRPGICGHPEIETALVELYRLTGQARYLALAQRMIDLRGTGTLHHEQFGSRYLQDHEPVRTATTVAGHAVRQLYLNAGVTDLYLETGEQVLLQAMQAQWRDAHQRKMYISGAFGSRHRDESFGSAYELPPDRAYAETCATIADIHWNWRMYLACGGGGYADTIERELYNALAASTDATGTRFFYSNPLQSRPDKHSEGSAPRDRVPWYSCACCPPNIARTIAQLSAYVAASTDTQLVVHQYSDADIDLPAHLGQGVVKVRTRYPDEGAVEITVDGEALPGTQLALRIPAWATGTTIGTQQADADGYLRVPLAAGARFSIDVTPRWTQAHPRVDATRGCVALERGPVLYAIEQIDLPDGIAVDDVRVLTSTAPALADRGVLELGAVAITPPDPLYRDTGSEVSASEPWRLAAIPFATWGNRGPGAMRVWLPVTD
ncbi:MAG: glycoside hydrolase family 127 protein [Beutenbergiaceae bacterium]